MSVAAIGSHGGGTKRHHSGTHRKHAIEAEIVQLVGVGKKPDDEDKSKGANGSAWRSWARALMLGELLDPQLASCVEMA